MAAQVHIACQVDVAVDDEDDDYRASMAYMSSYEAKGFETRCLWNL